MNLFSHNVPTGIPITWLIGLKNIMENICKDLHIFLIQILFKLSIFTVLSSFYDNFISTDNFHTTLAHFETLKYIVSSSSQNVQLPFCDLNTSLFHLMPV